jgi:hypothetical protein
MGREWKVNGRIVRRVPYAWFAQCATKVSDKENRAEPFHLLNPD